MIIFSSIFIIILFYANFQNSKKPGKWKPRSVFENKEVLILGTGPGVDKYKKALQTFQHASGMRINWDKSFIIWLGPFASNPPPLDPHDKIKQLNLNSKLRVLGVDLGHVQDQHWEV